MCSFFSLHRCSGCHITQLVFFLVIYLYLKEFKSQLAEKYINESKKKTLSTATLYSPCYLVFGIRRKRRFIAVYASSLKLSSFSVFNLFVRWIFHFATGFAHLQLFQVDVFWWKEVLEIASRSRNANSKLIKIPFEENALFDNRTNENKAE